MLTATGAPRPRVPDPEADRAARWRSAISERRAGQREVLDEPHRDARGPVQLRGIRQPRDGLADELHQAAASPAMDGGLVRASARRVGPAATTA